MKNNLLPLLIIILSIGITSHAQRKKLENPFENNGDLESRFIYLEKTSTNYKEYKVISKEGFLRLQQNTLDSIAALKKANKSKNATIATKDNEIDNLQKKVGALDAQLKFSITKQDSFKAFGNYIHKDYYVSIVYGIIGVLFALLLLFMVKFKQAKVITDKSKLQLSEAQYEFEVHQKKSLARQQELSRKLQDEILKNRKE